MRSLITVCVLIFYTVISTAQQTYVTSMKFIFSGGNNMGSAVGNDCGMPTKDIDIQFNSTDGTLDLTVNKICHIWSFMQHWFGSPYPPKPVFKNRFIEMRIQSTAEHTDLKVSFQVSGGIPEGSVNKTIPPIYFDIFKANTWEVKLLKLEGDADTVFKEIDYLFPNGFYKIDYVCYGDAAVPPLPVMDSVRDQSMVRGTLHSLDLTGIQIPERILEGLSMEVESVTDNDFFDVLYFENGKKTCFPQEHKAILHYKISETSSLTSDSLIVTLKDTIRGTSSSYKFKITTFPFSLSENSDQIKVYPTTIVNSVNIDFTELTSAKVDILNITGNILLTRNILNPSRETIDLSDVPQGVYIIKITEGNRAVVRRILKL